MEITTQEAILIQKLRELNEGDEAQIKIGSKYGHKIFIYTPSKREIIAEVLDKTIESAILPLKIVMKSVVYQQNDGQNP